MPAPGWLSRLSACLAADGAIGSATPWCNAGEAAAWPVQGFLRHYWNEFEYAIVNKRFLVDERSTLMDNDVRLLHSGRRARLPGNRHEAPIFRHLRLRSGLSAASRIPLPGVRVCNCGVPSPVCDADHVWRSVRVRARALWRRPIRSLCSMGAAGLSQ